MIQRRSGLLVASVATAIGLVGSPTSAAAQEAGTAGVRPAGTVHRIMRDRAPAIDGVPDETVWQDAPLLTDFIQQTPADGQPASEPTDVRILHDDQSIYVAVWAYDSDAAGIMAGDMIRDVDVVNSDAIVLIFDTYGDEQNGWTASWGSATRLPSRRGSAPRKRRGSTRTSWRST